MILGNGTVAALSPEPTALKKCAASTANRREELVHSNAELRHFASVAAHDLQEPLRTVSNYCRLLQDDCGNQLDQTARDYIQRAIDGIQRMRALIVGQLKSAQTANSYQSQPPTSAGEALAEAIQNLNAAIRAANAFVECGPMPTVAADHIQLVRLFQNLIGNALKFRGHVPPRINVWAKSQGDEWVFHVEDNGLGIAPRKQAEIFGMFQRLHPSEAYAGAGIGLAVCKQIVTSHGGRMWVRSAEGHGSDFCFALPHLRCEVFAPVSVPF